jgi:hypothetical protein
MNNRQAQSRISVLLSDWRQDTNAAILYLKRGLAYIALFVPNLDAMQPSHASVAHFLGNGMVATARQPVDTSAYEEMRSYFLPRAKQFIDIALTIANMDTSFRFTEKRR